MLQSLLFLPTRLEAALRWIAAYPLLLVQVVFMLLASWGLIGQTMGVEQLVWDDMPKFQFASGFGVGLLFGVILFVVYLLNPPTLIMGLLAPEDRLKEQRLIFTLFHRSKDVELRRLGAYLFWGLSGLLVLFAGPKIFDAPMYGLPAIAGYLVSILFSLLLYLVDEKFSIRERLKTSKWFLRLPYIRTPDTDEAKAREQGRRVAEKEEHSLHAIAIYLGIISVVLIGGVYLGEWINDQVQPRAMLALTSPVSYACIFLILFNLVYGPIVFHLHMQRLILAGIVLLLLVWNSTIFFPQNAYRMRFPGMDYENLAQLQDEDGKDNYYLLKQYSATFARDELIDDEAVLVAMHKDWANVHPGTKPKLLVYAVSGGGIRSAAWTAYVLEKLEHEQPQFRNHTRLFAGASGGMVGAAMYVGDFDPAREDRGTPQNLQIGEEVLSPVTATVMKQSLYPTIQQMVLHDLTTSLVWPPPGKPVKSDRGLILEQKWNANAMDQGYTKSPLSTTFADLRELEKSGKRPSLIFSPLMVEDSRRLLISNLNLETITQPKFATMGSTGAAPMALPAVEFHRLFPGDASKNFTLGTAARMSATFPFVTPAVSLPTHPPRRLVDAGYYDNNGIAVIAAWLAKNKNALMEHTSGIAIVEIRAFNTFEEHLGFNNSNDFNLKHRVSREVLPAEVDALLNVREHGSYYRNGEALALIEKLFNANTDRFVQNVIFEFIGDVPLNWYMSETHKTNLIAAWNLEQNQISAENLKNWFDTGGK